MRVPSLTAPQVQPAQIPQVRLDERVPNTGVGIAQGLDNLSGILDIERLKADRTAVTEAETQRDQWANTRLYDPQSGAFNRQGKDALGVTNEVLGDYDKQVGDTASKLNGRRQQEAYLQSTNAHRQALQGQLSRFEFAERGKYEDQTAGARMSSAIETGALNYNDPTTIGQSRQAILDTLRVQKTAKGWDDETLKAATLGKLTDLHSSVIERMLADGKTGQAKQYLTATKSELTADDQLKMARAIDTAEREGRNELAAQVRQQVADLSASYKAGLPVPSGQELPRGILEAAFPGKGNEIYDSLQADKRMGSVLKDLNQQSPAQVNESLKGFEVTQGGAGAHDALERQGDLQRAARASLEARTKSPAQFAIDNGLGYKPLPNDPQAASRELQNREAVRAQTSRQVGLPVPMLTPDEAKAIGQNLAASDAKAAVQTFDYFRNSVGDAAYSNIMQSIAPDSPVKAYAGQIYGKPAPITLKAHLFGPDEQTTARVVAQTLVTGENLINKTKGAKGEDGKPVGNLYLPNKNQFEQAFAESVGDAFAGRPEAESLALEVAYAYYTGKSAETGRLNQDTLDIDSKLVRESFRSAIGETFDFNGYGHVVAPLGMDESAFNDRAQSAFAAELAARKVPESEQKSAVRDFGSLGLRNWHANQYLVTKGRDPFSYKGEPIVITVK